MEEDCRQNAINVENMSSCPVIQTARHLDIITKVQVSLLFLFRKIDNYQMIMKGSCLVSPNSCRDPFLTNIRKITLLRKNTHKLAKIYKILHALHHLK